jgi:flagellar motor protein MotB
MANVNTSGTPSSFPSAPPRQPSGPIGLQAAWPVGLGAVVVICCVLALVWLAHQQALEKTRIQSHESEISKTWRDAAQQLVQSLLAEVSVLNSNQADFAVSQAHIGAGLAKLSIIDVQLASMVSDQADATRRLAAAQATLAQETTNLVPSLRQSLQQGLAEAANQSRADTVKLQSEVADLAASLRQSLQQGLAVATNQSRADSVKLQSEVADLAASLRQSLQQGLAVATNQSRADTMKLQSDVADLAASLRQTFQQGLAKTATQSRAETAKLQSKVAEVAASNKALLDRLSESTNVPNLALALPGVRTKTLGNSILLTFDDGLFLCDACFKADAKSRLQAVAQALAQVSPPLQIDVIGCADDDRVFGSWTARFEESLALERATAVVNYFIELGLFAPKRLAALSSSCANRPFPSDTVQNRAKNRTAVLRISREEKPM